MSQTYGMEAPRPHHGDEEQPPVRYVVLIRSASTEQRLARLFLQDRRQVAELDAGAPEVMLMTDALAPARDAAQPEWDCALAGHNAAERAEAEVYTLDI